MHVNELYLLRHNYSLCQFHCEVPLTWLHTHSWDSMWTSLSTPRSISAHSSVSFSTHSCSQLHILPLSHRPSQGRGKEGLTNWTFPLLLAPNCEYHIHFGDSCFQWFREGSLGLGLSAEGARAAALDSISTPFVEHRKSFQRNLWLLWPQTVSPWGLGCCQGFTPPWSTLRCSSQAHSILLLSWSSLFFFVVVVFLSTWQSSPPAMGLSKLQP